MKSINKDQLLASIEIALFNIFTNKKGNKMKTRFTRCYVAIAVVVAMMTTVSEGNAQKYTLYMDSIENVGKENTQVSVSLRTKGFKNVLGIQGSINWDTAALNYSSISYGTSAIGINASAMNLASTANGYVTVAWTDANLNPETVVDTTILFTLTFTVKKIIVGGITIDVSDVPTALSLIDGNFSAITDTAYIPGYVGFVAATPVSLKGFEATGKDNAVLLNWSTTEELNTDHFNVQHSTDGSSFTSIGTVKAIGIGANSYAFTDSKPTNGTNYYRLQSVDKDGSLYFSKIVSASLTTHHSPLIIIYPNPTKEALTIRGSHIATVQAINNSGKVLKVVSFRDATNPTLAVSNLPTGAYHLRIQTTDGNVGVVGFVKE